MKTRLKSRRGITLFEVVLALVIFLVTLPALNTLVQIGTKRAEESHLIALASLQCRSKLAEVTAGAEPLATIDWTPLTDANWSWRLDANDAGVDGLKTVQVWVKFELPGTNVETTLSQMILDPAFRGSTQDRSLLMSSSSSTSPATGTTTGATP